MGILGETICSKRLTERQSPNMVLIVTMMWSSITASDDMVTDYSLKLPHLMHLSVPLTPAVQQVTWSLGEATL